jgi:hypothetical protein
MLSSNSGSRESSAAIMISSDLRNAIGSPKAVTDQSERQAHPVSHAPLMSL